MMIFGDEDYTLLRAPDYTFDVDRLEGKWLVASVVSKYRFLLLKDPILVDISKLSVERVNEILKDVI